MDSIVAIETDVINNTIKNFNLLIKYLDKTFHLDKDSMYNIIDKLRLLNNNINSINSDINDIIYDITNGKSLIDDNLKKRLKEESEINTMIKDLSPLILAYQLNKMEH